MAKTIPDLQKSCKYMADHDEYKYGKWNIHGNGTAANPGNGKRWDCGTGLTRAIRNAISGELDDDTPLTWYIWPDNDPSPYFDNYLLEHGFTRHAFNHQKALASGYEFVPVVGKHHVWAYWSTSKNLQFELNDGYKGCGADSHLSVDIHPTIVYSDAEYMYFPTGWDKGTQLKNGLSDEPEKDGRYAYYTNGKIDTSVTGLFENTSGWYFVKDGYVATYYWGLAQGKYGWWVVEGGKVNFNARTGFYGLCISDTEYAWYWCEEGKVQENLNDVVKDPYDGSWKIVRGGRWIEDFNGIAANKNGVWHIVNGMVDFTPGTYNIEIQVNDDGYVIL